MKRILLLLLILLPMTLPAQRERNYIYLLDCTKSMIGYNGSPNIWIPTKSYLKGELDKHAPGTTLHVVPFQGDVLPSINFNAEGFNAKKWNEIEEKIDGYVQNVTGTNICDAWDSTGRFIDLHKDNYIILLTDGKDTKNGMAAVAKKLSEWCGKYPNTYAFYVQLTEAAIDKGVAKVIDVCDNEFVVDASKGIPVFGNFEKGLTIYANTLNLKRIHKLGFSAAGEYVASAVCKDPYFDVKILNNKIKDGQVLVQISTRKPIAEINNSIPQTYEFTFEVKANSVKVINPTVRVQMTNKPERALDIISEETYVGEATWYDRFLFWGASDPDTLTVDLKALFNAEAKKDGSVVEFNIKDSDGRNDFALFYNGLRIENGTINLKANDNVPSFLSVVYNAEAKEGTRYLTINSKTKANLDKINDEPVEQYTLTLRSEYDVCWNPLKTILMWLGIIILAALILWFLLIKHFLYPTIGVKTIQINDPYFSKVNVKGKRRVVFTNQRMEQGFLSRIFTGKILYKKNEIWTSPLAFEPGSKKKTLRVVRTKDYTIDPYSSVLKAPNDFIIENVNNKTKIKMTIN